MNNIGTLNTRSPNPSEEKLSPQKALIVKMDKAIGSVLFAPVIAAHHAETGKWENVSFACAIRNLAFNPYIYIPAGPAGSIAVKIASDMGHSALLPTIAAGAIGATAGLILEADAAGLIILGRRAYRKGSPVIKALFHPFAKNLTKLDNNHSVPSKIWQEIDCAAECIVNTAMVPQCTWLEKLSLKHNTP